jgi:multicomponent Na+:H+ antiporter subunit D
LATAIAAWPALHRSLRYYPLLLILLMGVCGAFLTGDMFNLYVWFEVMLIASFVLLRSAASGPARGRLKYVTLNLVSSASSCRRRACSTA